jgi:uncharacterized membrane protein
MRRFPGFLLFVICIFFLIGATVPPESIIPTIAITIVTAILLPLLVEGVKLLASKTGKQWLVGKTAASIYGWAIALLLVVIYYDWKALPALPADPNEAIKQILFYGTFIAKAAEFAYNAIISKLFDEMAKKPGSVFAYKLQ